MTYISKIEDSGYLFLENSKARALITPELSFRLDFDDMEIFPEDIPEAPVEVDNALGAIKEALENGVMSIVDLKVMLKGKVKATKIDTLIRELKNKEFKMFKDGEIWMVELMNKPINHSAINVVETVYQMDEVDGLF